jgi:hypothetical protein
MPFLCREEPKFYCGVIVFPYVISFNPHENLFIIKKLSPSKFQIPVSCSQLRGSGTLSHGTASQNYRCLFQICPDFLISRPSLTSCGVKTPTAALPPELRSAFWLVQLLLERAMVREVLGVVAWTLEVPAYYPSPWLHSLDC